jgi:hypothetical protein
VTGVGVGDCPDGEQPDGKQPDGEQRDGQRREGESPQEGFDPARRVRGEVALFDEQVGLGELIANIGSFAPGLRYPFHCTQISDGSRRIAVGTPVTFSVAAGRRGIWEATRIVPQPAEEPA